MSIIYDALKKTEKAINSNLKATPDTKDKHPKSIYQLYILYVIVACVGLAIGNIIFSFLPHSKTPSLKQSKSTLAVKNDRLTQVKETPQVTQTTPMVATPSETAPMLPIDIKNKSQVSLVLNGVFFSKNEGYALINNRIVKEGDVLEDATVKRIKLDEVELEAEDGSTIKLSTNVR
jgi:hypothetical protein